MHKIEVCTRYCWLEKPEVTYGDEGPYCNNFELPEGQDVRSGFVPFLDSPQYEKVLSCPSKNGRCVYHVQEDYYPPPLIT